MYLLRGAGYIESANTNTDCFPVGTLVQTPNGLRKIETLSAGELVTTWSERRKEWSVVAPVLCRKKHLNSEVMALALEDGQEIAVTAAHSLMTSRGWVKVWDITTDDMVLTENGFLRCVGLRNEGKGFTTFNLVVCDDFSFVANGVVGHSFTLLRGARMAVWRFRAAIERMFQRFPKPGPHGEKSHGLK